MNAIDQIPADCKYLETLISIVQNKKQPESDALAKFLELIVEANACSKMGKLEKW